MKVKSGVKIKATNVTLSREQIKFYDENGFLVIPLLFDEEACDTVKSLAETVADEDYPVTLNIHRKIKLFLDIMKDPVLVSIIKTVQRHPVVGLNSQYLYKRAGTPYAKQSWTPHQDSAYVNARHGTYIQVHIFLEPSDKENGGLFYYAGSHKEDILPYEYAKSWKEDFDEHGISHPGWKIKNIPPEYMRVDVVGPKGGICLQHGDVIHGSYPNLTEDRSRGQYSMAYMNVGEKFLRGRTSIKAPVILE